MLNNYHLDELIKRALEEDLGSGDITTLATVERSTQIAGKFISKEAGVVCGLPLMQRVFELVDATISIVYQVSEGDALQKGQLIAEISGNARGILTGERVALNFLQLLSGIATRTKKAVDDIATTKAIVTDTRKTTPGLRIIEKYAVRIGGGSSHRYNLAEGVLIKDNHIRAAGSIKEAIARARARASHMLKIEVEVENFQQIEEALQNGADIIMLDNMSIKDMQKAVHLIDGKALVEASGNMGEKDLLAVAETGVDLISIGGLTHTIRALDISLRFEELA